MTGEWTQLKVECSTDKLDLICDVMSAFDSHLQIDDPNDVDRLDTCYGELIGEELMSADRTRAAVSIYLSPSKNPAEYVALIKERLFAISGDDFGLTVNGVREEDWADCWKQYYKPIKIGKRLMVVPKWEKYDPEDDEIILSLDPGMAFGTGTHETTRLCSSLLEDHLKPGMDVIDVGTGSGILAIAASKLGAGNVRAYDIDPDAVRIAAENAEENGCKNVVCGVSDLLKNVDRTKKYDFMTANIVADIVIRLAPDIRSCMKQGGLVAVSGIIDRQAEEVRRVLTANGLREIVSLTDNDWNSMLFVTE